MNLLIQFKNNIVSLLLIGLACGCFGLLRTAEAVVPAPDGGYPGANTAEGQNALLSLTTGVNNTALGWFSLKSNTDGQLNTAVGAGTLFSTVHASRNTAIGGAALFSNTDGSLNTAVGALALLHNTIGDYNTAVGDSALFNNAGGSNTATGAFALFANTDGFQNTANGNFALQNNTAGSFNTAHGFYALRSNTTGTNNTAIGDRTLLLNETGGGNTAIGAQALLENIGDGNTAVGAAALSFNTTGAFNIALGFLAGLAVTTASNVICIGADGADVSDSCYIGNIFDAASVAGSAVFVSSDNKLGTITSSKRFKQDIKPMEQASEALFALTPVTFHYKREVDPTRTPQFGLVAEDVEKVNPALIVRDKEGKPYSVRYDQVNAMLLNEFLKEHREVEELQATIGQLKASAAKQEAVIGELKKDIGVLAAHLKEQASQIQKVNDRVESTTSWPQMVLSNQ
jgi:hypothetical protein